MHSFTKKLGICLFVGALALSALAEEITVAKIMVTVKAKMAAGQIKSESDLAEEMKQLESLYERFRGKNDAGAAEALIVRAEIWTHLFKKPAKGLPLYQKIVKEYPDSEIGNVAATNVKQLTAQARHDAAVRSLVNGVRFPAFDSRDFSGRKLSSKGLNGKVYLVQMWATWCHACNGELPHLKRAYAKFRDEGLEMIGINQDDKIEPARRFVSQKEVNWPQIFDGDGELQIRYGAGALPRLFLVDQHGYIAASGMELRGGNLERTIKRVLKGRSETNK